MKSKISIVLTNIKLELLSLTDKSGPNTVNTMIVVKTVMNDTIELPNMEREGAFRGSCINETITNSMNDSAKEEA